MRPKERIPIFLNLVDGNYTDVLCNAYGLNDDELEIDVYVDRIYDRIDEIRLAWEDNPDWRFSQVLVNTGIIPNKPGFWYYKEELEVLDDLGIDRREFLLWGQNYDKDMNRLPETIYRPIKDLNTDHIKAILDGGWCKAGSHFECLKEELKRREDG
jgi:hypothetical protein